MEDIKIFDNITTTDDIGDPAVASMAKCLLKIYNANPEYWDELFKQQGVKKCTAHNF